MTRELDPHLARRELVTQTSRYIIVVIKKSDVKLAMARSALLKHNLILLFLNFPVLVSMTLYSCKFINMYVL